jgi:hypothetical protein
MNSNTYGLSLREKIKYCLQDIKLRDEITDLIIDEFNDLTEKLGNAMGKAEAQAETIAYMRKALDNLKPIIDELYLLPDFDDFKPHEYALLFEAIDSLNEIASADYD